MKLQISVFWLVTICVSCLNPSSADKTKEISEFQFLSDSTHLTESLNNAAIDSSETRLEIINYPPFQVYSVSTLSTGPEFNVSFVSLTDSYRWREHPDSVIIDKSQLKKYSSKDYNLHTISKEKRALFFHQQGLQESDSLYIYFLKEDSLLAFPLSGLPLKGMVTPYVTSRQFPVPEHYFMIGFDLETKNTQELMSYTRTTLTSISSSNPFNMGKAEEVQFEEITEDLFPEKDTSAKKYPHQKHYLYSNAEYNYFAKDRGEKYLRERRVIVIRKQDNKKVFDRWYLPSEGTETNPIMLENKYIEPGIWTGKVFKSRPPILMGNQYQSFGCPSIQILGLKEESIYIQCDNRH